jgi:hypothetical protein
LKEEINEQIARMALAGRFEKLSASEYAQMQNAIRYQQVKIVEILENGTGNGIYKCYSKLLDSDYWDDDEGGDKLDDFDESNVIEVLNLFESKPEAAEQHNLSKEDRLLAWQWLDDGKKSRWVGIPLKGTGEGLNIHKAYPIFDAGEGTTIYCYLDYNGNDAEEWEAKIYLKDEMCIGSDGQAYRHFLSTDEQAETANDEPITGQNYAQKWVIVEIINVHCIIIAGTDLNAADPELTKGQLIEVVKFANTDDWYFNGHLQGEFDCEGS